MIILTQIFYGTPRKVALEKGMIIRITENSKKNTCWLNLADGRKMLVKGTVKVLVKKLKRHKESDL